MTLWVKYVSTLLLGVGVTLSCKNSEQCERSRMDVARLWNRVKEGANRRRNADDGTIKSPEFQKKWSRIVNQAELVSSSFETEQVTWDPAAKGQKQLLEDTSDMAGSADPANQNFAKLLEEANRKVAEFEKACR
jgi:hypothetical protein